MIPNFLFAAIYFMFHKYSTALYINDTYFFKLGFTPRKYGQSVQGVVNRSTTKNITISQV